MTDQAIPTDATDDERRLAREWAESVESNTDFWGDRVRAAARVILHDIPAPPLPTLADMSPEERAACLRMQCDTGPNRSVRGFIAEVHPGGCRVIERDTWAWRSCSDDMVTPRPDLPRLQWPGGTPTGPDHLAVGTVIESADDPRIAALPVGSVLIDSDEEATIKGRGDWTGAGYIPIPSEGAELGPWKVLHIPKEAGQ